MADVTLSGPIVQRTAAATLSGHRAVRSVAGEVNYASSADPDGLDATLGITTGAVILGATADVQVYGPMLNNGWGWTPGEPIYVGVDGALTQTPPASGAVLQIAIAETATTIFIDLKQPIRR